MAPKNRLTAYIPLMFTSLLTLVLFFLVDDFVIEVLLKPVLRFFWFISLVVRTIPQGILWAVFILIMIFLVASGFREDAQKASPTWRASKPLPGRVETWTRWLVGARRSRYARWRLSKELRKLTRELLSPYEGEERVRLGLDDLDLPEDIRAYLEAPYPVDNQGRNRWWQTKKETDPTLELEPQRVLDFLRKRLGI
jgi:hypothetical protein